tara:strand:+ start:112 stop:780 length:669 start_codon:yes stop_codon:yes gene_type:complete
MLKKIINLFNSDSLYHQALGECYAMLEIDRQMFNASVDSLRSEKTDEYPLDIYAMDKKINQFEREVRRKIMTHLSVGTQQEDIGPGLVLTSIVIDIERIGDYTKNIYDLAIKYPGFLSCGKHESQVTSIELATRDFLNSAIDAFKNQDTDLARELMEGYKKDISSASSEIVNEVISGSDKTLLSGQASALCLYLRYLKRISAHSKNLVSSIVNPFERIGYSE